MIYKLKKGVKSKDLQLIEPALWILLTRTFLYCSEHKLPCTITSLINDRGKIKSKSQTHQTGRAFDLSSKDWPEFYIHNFQHVMNTQYSEIAAISATDMKPRAAVYHDAGYGSHFHIQVKPNANWKRFIK